MGIDVTVRCFDENGQKMPVAENQPLRAWPAKVLVPPHQKTKDIIVKFIPSKEYFKSAPCRGIVLLKVSVRPWSWVLALVLFSDFVLFSKLSILRKYLRTALVFSYSQVEPSGPTFEIDVTAFNPNAVKPTVSPSTVAGMSSSLLSAEFWKKT